MLNVLALEVDSPIFNHKSPLYNLLTLRNTRMQLITEAHSTQRYKYLIKDLFKIYF